LEAGNGKDGFNKDKEIAKAYFDLTCEEKVQKARVEKSY